MDVNTVLRSPLILGNESAGSKSSGLTTLATKKKKKRRKESYNKEKSISPGVGNAFCSVPFLAGIVYFLLLVSWQEWITSGEPVWGHDFAAACGSVKSTTFTRI